jgi:hypothetical protein
MPKKLPRFDYQVDEGLHIYTLVDASLPAVRLAIETAGRNHLGQLWGTVTAWLEDDCVAASQFNLLDQNRRVDFGQVAATFDGHVPWHDLLLAIVPDLLGRLQSSVREAAETASAAHTPWPEPQAIPDILLPVAGFEPALLPEALRPWIMDISERMQCPGDYPAVAAMVALAGMVGRRVGIRPKCRDDWLVVPNLWGAVIGRPGVLKTPAIQEPLKPLMALEVVAHGIYEAEVLRWKAASIVAGEQEKVVSAGIRDALKKGQRQHADILAQSMLAQAKPEPVRQRLIVNDVTVEKLGELLNQNPYGLLLFRDELTGFLRTLDREGHEADRAFYLEAWNGTGCFTYDRISRGTIDIEAACVSILGGIQPGPLAHYLHGALTGGVGDDGLIQRFQMLVWPDISGHWRDVDTWPDGDARRKAREVFARLHRLTASDVDASPDELAGGIPFLHFSDAAQEVFTEWRTELEHRLRRGDEHPAIEAHLSKYRSLIPSLALLIHLADGHKGPVALYAMEAAAAWAEYLESHARRVYSRGMSADYASAKALASRLVKGELPAEFALPDVYRAHWAELRDRDEAKRAVDVLLDLHWLRERTLQTGGRPRRVYTLNPHIEGRAGDVA